MFYAYAQFLIFIFHSIPKLQHTHTHTPLAVTTITEITMAATAGAGFIIAGYTTTNVVATLLLLTECLLAVHDTNLYYSHRHSLVTPNPNSQSINNRRMLLKFPCGRNITIRCCCPVLHLFQFIVPICVIFTRRPPSNTSRKGCVALAIRIILQGASSIEGEITRIAQATILGE